MVLLGWLVCLMSFLVKTLLCVVNCQLHVVWLSSALAFVLSICSLTWHYLTGSMKWFWYKNFFFFYWMYVCQFKHVGVGFNVRKGSNSRSDKGSKVSRKKTSKWMADIWVIVITSFLSFFFFFFKCHSHTLLTCVTAANAPLPQDRCCATDFSLYVGLWVQLKHPILFA